MVCTSGGTILYPWDQNPYNLGYDVSHYKSFQDIAIIDKVNPGGSEWQKPPGNKQNNSKVENHHLNSKITALVAQSGKNTRE